MIPKLYYISQGDTCEEHLINIQKACASGAELVQLRLKNVESNTVLKIAGKAREITAHFQTRFIINDYFKIAKEVKADGVHLGKLDGCPSEAREHLFSWQIIGGTANTLSDCKALINKKVDYLGVGPYQFTSTKKQLSPILGINGFKNIMAVIPSTIPVFAIGGIGLQDVSDLMHTGVHGLAVSGQITQDFNRISTFKELINGGPTQTQIWRPSRTNNTN